MGAPLPGQGGKVGREKAAPREGWQEGSRVEGSRGSCRRAKVSNRPEDTGGLWVTGSRGGLQDSGVEGGVRSLCAPSLKSLSLAYLASQPRLLEGRAPMAPPTVASTGTAPG